jgi:hypothetical protein
MEDVLSCVDQKMQGLFKELNEKVDETQLDLQAVKTSLDTWRKNHQESLADTRKDLHEELGLMFQVEVKTVKALLETTQQKFQSQLDKVEARAEWGRGTGACASMVQPPKFDGTTSWAVFRCQFETVAEHNCWMSHEKSTYLITALQGWATDVLHGIPKGASYEETLQAMEDRFGDQHFAAACRSQLEVRTQRDGESLQEFAMAIKQLAHCAYPTLPEDHIRREAGKAFSDRVENPDKNSTAARRREDGKRGPQTGTRTTDHTPYQASQNEHQDILGSQSPPTR